MTRSTASVNGMAPLQPRNRRLPRTLTGLGTHQNDERRCQLQRVESGFNVCLKATKRGNLWQRKRSFWRCPSQNDRGRYLFSATGLGWNIRGASQEYGGAVCARRSRQWKSLPTRQKLKKRTLPPNPTQPGGTSPSTHFQKGDNHGRPYPRL